MSERQLAREVWPCTRIDSDLPQADNNGEKAVGDETMSWPPAIRSTDLRLPGPTQAFYPQRSKHLQHMQKCRILFKVA